MTSRLAYLVFIVIALLLAACGARMSDGDSATATPFILTSTLPPTLTPQPSETSLPPPPQPTIVPVEGTASTQINVRAEPSTASDVLGIILVNTKVQIIGKDPGGNWWQILYPEGVEGKGWVTAQYVTTATQPEVPIIGGDESNPNSAGNAVILQQLNVRSGPGTSFDSLGILNANDVVNLTGKDANGAWLQIEFVSAPDGKGWVNAAFAQAQGVENLPIVSDAGEVVGTGTPTGVPLPASRTPTVIPAPMDSDSAGAPAINIAFSATGTHSIQYSSDVSSPTGDMEDWLQFTPYSQSVLIDLSCIGNESLVLELLQNNSPMKNDLTCGESTVIKTNAGTVYLIHIQPSASVELSYIQYTLRINSLP